MKSSAISFVSGAVAGGAVKTLTAPLSRSTILLQTAQNEAFRGTSLSYWAFVRRSLEYLRAVGAMEGALSFWKGNGASILQKMATTGSNYVIYDYLKSMLKPCWRSETDVGFGARLAAGVMAGAFNVTVAYPLDLARTNIAVVATNVATAATVATTTPAKKKGEWASIAPTLRKLHSQHGNSFLTRGLMCTQICQGFNIGLHFGIYETLSLTRSKVFKSDLKNTTSERAPRNSLLHSVVCGTCAGLVASTVTQPFDLVRRRQQVIGATAGDQWFFNVMRDIVRQHGLRGLYRGIVPELVKVCLVPSSGLNFFVYEFVRQDIFGEKSGVR